MVYAANLFSVQFTTYSLGSRLWAYGIPMRYFMVLTHLAWRGRLETCSALINIYGFKVTL